MRAHTRRRRAPTRAAARRRHGTPTIPHVPRAAGCRARTNDSPWLARAAVHRTDVQRMHSEKEHLETELSLLAKQKDTLSKQLCAGGGSPPLRPTPRRLNGAHRPS